MLAIKRPPRNLSSESDAELLRLTGEERDGDAFAVFYRRHEGSLRSFLWRHTASYEIAQDLTSEAFAVVFVKAASYDPTRAAPRTWLIGIARVALLASYHRHRVEERARRKLGLTVRPYSEEAWERAEARIDASLSSLVAGLDGLSATERDAVIARIVEERDYAEIARAENASEAAIRQRVSRGLRKLAKIAKPRPPR